MMLPHSIAERPERKSWHNRSVEEVLTQLGASATGLSAQEVIRRLAADGPNELREVKRISPIQIFFGQFKSLIVWILIAAGVISGLLGERVDAIAILAIVVLNAIVGFYQEFNAEKSISALKVRPSQFGASPFLQTSISCSWLSFLSDSRCGVSITRF